MPPEWAAPPPRELIGRGGVHLHMGRDGQALGRGPAPGVLGTRTQTPEDAEVRRAYNEERGPGRGLDQTRQASPALTGCPDLITVTLTLIRTLSLVRITASPNPRLILN